MREQLPSYLPWFVSTVAKIPGVRRISLLGSITTNKQDPKDIDFLVVVDDDLNLAPLARFAGAREATGIARGFGKRFGATRGWSSELSQQLIQTRSTELHEAARKEKRIRRLRRLRRDESIATPCSVNA